MKKTIEELKRAPHPKLYDSYKAHADLLVDPVTKEALRSTEEGLLSSSFCYPIIKGTTPILLPHKVIDNSNLAYDTQDPLIQYSYLAYVKAQGDTNASYDSDGYKRYLFLASEFYKNVNLSGLTLDVGCDNTMVSSLVFPSKCKYVGIEPALKENKSGIVGMAEFLPFRDATFENVVFNTSLDHILDYHTALEEANRVLKPNGTLVVATNVWYKDATLLRDIVHFHHFRTSQLEVALNQIGELSIYNHECLRSLKNRGFSFFHVRKNP